MLVEIAIADAYGQGFEFCDPSRGRVNDGANYVRNQSYAKLHPGMYTDDAQMSLAVAECLLDGSFTREDFAEAFVRSFRRDRRDGYARRFQAFLETTVDGTDFIARIQPNSERSGAAMRAGPVGLFADISQVLSVCETQARLTHDTPAGIAAAKGAALMVHHQAYGIGSVAELPDFLATHVPEVDWKTPFRDRTRHSGTEIARAALAGLLDSRSYRDLLTTIVDYGGDTDTVAAIAMAAASVSAEFADDLPDTLWENLENGTYGRDLLVGHDALLAERFALPAVAADHRWRAGISVG